MVNITLQSGIVTAILGAVSYGLTNFVANEPQYSAPVGFIVTLIAAFISFEKAQTPAPATTTTPPAA